MKGFVLTGVTESGNEAVRRLNIKDKKALITLKDNVELNAELNVQFFSRFINILPLLEESSEVFIHRYMRDKGLVRDIDYKLSFY